MSTTNTTLTDTVESTDNDDAADPKDYDRFPNEVYHWSDRDYRKLGDGDSFVYEHQITACIDHSPYEVFSPRKTVHHETGFKGDNRREALSVRTITEHQRLHRGGDWIEINGEPRLRRTEGDVTNYGSD